MNLRHVEKPDPHRSEKPGAVVAHKSHNRAMMETQPWSRGGSELSRRGSPWSRGGSKLRRGGSVG